jgi:hypothetical protein
MLGRMSKLALAEPELSSDELIDEEISGTVDENYWAE